MNCFKCGTKLEPTARFCGTCGSAQPATPAPNTGGNPEPANPRAVNRPVAKTVFQGGGTSPSQPRPVAPPSGSTPTRDPAQYAPAKAAPPNEQQDSPLRTIPDGAQVPPIVRPQAAPAPAPAPKPVAAARPALPVAAKKPPIDLAGQTLNNRYLVEEKIGEGGFGAVYRARQTQMNRVVALKVLHPKMAKDPQIVGRFKREAQASSLLRAPHTVQVYDFDQTPDGVMYLAMELLQGRSLHSLLYEGGPFDTLRTGRALSGIAESLSEAHQQGIVHRDIKPENIYLEPRPEVDFVKVLDFGIAKIVSGESGLSSGPALTAAGQTLGTLEYMSPEQLMGAQLDGRSDLYAVGILGYELLTGKLPFEGRTPAEMITGHLKIVPPAPSLKMPGSSIPPLMDHIILKLLEKKRENRYKDGEDLRNDLRRLIDGEINAPQKTPAPQLAVASSGAPISQPQAIPLATTPGAPGVGVHTAQTTNHPTSARSSGSVAIIVGIFGVLAIVGVLAYYFLLRAH